MRPLRLEFSAFITYADKTVVDFEKLGEKGLYLITGVTGAGKTTIFDAITFALFGQASGDERKNNMLRSKYASPETSTYVELTFENSGKKYTVKRNPEYERASKRGTGTTTEKASAELHFPDGRICTKTAEVDTAIKEILGIERERFSQIAMLAQGEFKKLLLADTKDRQKIFREIFKTNRYETLQTRLKETANELERDCENVKLSTSQYLKGIICDEDNPISIDVRKAKSGMMTVAESIALINNLCEQDSKKRRDIEIQDAELDKKLEVVNALLVKAEEYRKTEVALKNARAEIIAIKGRANKLKEEYEIAIKRQKDADDLSSKAMAIKALFSEYDRRDAKEIEANSLRLEIKKTESLASEKITEQESVDADLTRLRFEKKALENAGSNKERLLRSIDDYCKEKTSMEAIIGLLEEYHLLEKRLELAQERYEKCRSVADEAKGIYERRNRLYLDNQAGLLAKGLINGLPCPVCGSREHPHPARHLPYAPTDEELQTAKHKAEGTQRDSERASRTAGVIKGSFDEKAKELKRKSLDLLDTENIDEIENRANEAINAINTAVSVARESVAEEDFRIKRREELENLIPRKENENDVLKKTVNEINNKLVHDRTLLKEIENSLIEYADKLVYRSKLEAITAYDKMNAERDTILSSIKNADAALKEADNALSSSEGRVTQLEDQLKTLEEQDVERLAKEKDVIVSTKGEVGDILSEVKARISINSGVLRNVSMNATELGRLENKLSLVKALSNTANGSVQGKEKIMLETFVQMTFFDRIIARANTRFMIMSDGQFELVRCKSSDDLRSQSGLELNVIDHYNGSERSVKSLSGGESFKAALSLALGLSDEIQSSAGGIKLDTMFVDEGFGSLDDESLNQAMKALSGLTEANKLVGIISHVSELKDRIDRQIIVTRDKGGGSSLSICV